jgi:hypothetical protein
MNYIKRFVEKVESITTQYGELKYDVNEDEKNILVDSGTKDVLKSILVFDRDNFSRLDTDCYILFYDDDNEEEIFEILEYQKKS